MQENENTATANKKIVEEVYANFAEGDMDGSLAKMDKEIVWEHPEHEGIPFASTFNGHAGVREFFNLAMSNIDVLEQTVNDVVASGDKVVALGYEKMRVKKNGRIYESPWAHVYTFRDGKIVEFQEYIDTAEIAAAFGGN